MGPRAEKGGSKHISREDCLVREANIFRHYIVPTRRCRLRPLCSRYHSHRCRRIPGSTRKRHSQEDVSLHPGVWRWVPLSTLTILKTFLTITFYYTDFISLIISSKHEEQKSLSSRKCRRDLEGSGATRNGKVLSKNQVNSSPSNLVGGPSFVLPCPGGLSTQPGDAEVNRHLGWHPRRLGHSPQEPRYRLRPLLKTMSPALPNSEAQIRTRRGRAEGRGQVGGSPAASPAAAPRTLGGLGPGRLGVPRASAPAALTRKTW